MKKIMELIGIENTTYCAIKQQLLQIVESFDNEVVLEEVVDVDAIIDYGLRRISAIAINQKVVFQQKKKNLELGEHSKLIQPHL